MSIHKPRKSIIRLTKFMFNDIIIFFLSLFIYFFLFFFISGGITCLHNAARSGRIDVIKLLLENNADHTIKNSEQFTPLEEVIEFGDKDLAASLLSLISPQHSDGYIPSMF